MFKVLIAEDDPMVAMINGQYVGRNSRFKVVGTCADGKSALAFLEQNEVDLVILDVYMPQMDGLETLKSIRRSGSTVSVIMVTAANDIPTFEEAIRLGAEDYLVKPFTFERFRQALEKFESRADLMRKGRTLNQGSIDMLLGTAQEAREEVPKGIQEKTVSVILQCLAGHTDWMTGDDIAAGTGLSAVTVRRYMNYLVQNGDVSGRMNYETGGRPCMLYRLGS